MIKVSCAVCGTVTYSLHIYSERQCMDVKESPLPWCPSCPPHQKSLCQMHLQRSPPPGEGLKEESTRGRGRQQRDGFQADAVEEETEECEQNKATIPQQCFTKWRGNHGNCNCSGLMTGAAPSCVGLNSERFDLICSKINHTMPLWTQETNLRFKSI